MIIIILNESQEFHINTGLWQLELAAPPALHVSCLLRLGASEAWAVTGHACTASSKTCPISVGFLHFPRTTDNKQPFPQLFPVRMVGGITPLSLTCIREQVTTASEPRIGSQGRFLVHPILALLLQPCQGASSALQGSREIKN